MTDVSSDGRDDFIASLAHRQRAARALEQDLLTDVPLLYGGPGEHEPEGDPGIVLARLHAAERIRRFGSVLPRQESEPRRFWTSTDGLVTIATLVFVVLACFGVID